MLLIDRDENKYDEIVDKLVNNSDYRRSYCELDFSAFYLYYFCISKKIQFFGIKEFHKDIIRNLVSGKNFLCIGFRGSAKSTIMTNIYILWLVIFKKRKYILMLCFKLESAEEKVLNVGNILRTNNNITEDYGIKLLRENNNKAKKEDRMSEFTTVDNIKVVAVSLENITRGKQKLDYNTSESIRPDFLACDDIDIEEKAPDGEVVQKRYRHFISSALHSITGQAIISGNVVGMGGVNTLLRDEVAIKSKAWIYQQIDLISDGEIVRKEKFKQTIEEVEETYEEYKIKVGDEYAENPMKAIDDLKLYSSYSSDYMNTPNLEVGKPVFNKENIEKLEILKPLESIDIIIDGETFVLDIFSKDFDRNILNRCYLGGDLGGGDGGDFTDLTFLDVKGSLFARLTSDKLNYKKLLKLLVILYRDYKIFYFRNSLGIENNYLGKAFFDEMDDLRKTNSYVRELQRVVYVGWVKDGKTTKRSNKMGWNTNMWSKETLKTDLGTAINMILLQLDKKSKKEFLAWCILEKNGKITYTNSTMLAKHDDSVISYGVGFQMFLQNNKRILGYKKD